LAVDARRPVDWTQLAHTAGDFDQAHFSKEFREFTGHKPNSYLALRRQVPGQRELPAGQRHDARRVISYKA
jgi:hypothetical protein